MALPKSSVYRQTIVHPRGFCALRTLSSVSCFPEATSIPTFYLAFDMEDGLPRGSFWEVGGGSSPMPRASRARNLESERRWYRWGMGLAPRFKSDGTSSRKEGRVYDIEGGGRIMGHSRWLRLDCEVTRLYWGPIAISICAEELVIDAEQGTIFDIPKDSATSVAALGLVNGGEGGWRGVFPHFLGVVKTSLDPATSVSIFSASSEWSTCVWAFNEVDDFPLYPTFNFTRKGKYL